MVPVREPILNPVAIVDLRPTQITVEMHEVEVKRKAWRTKEGDKGGKFLGQHMIPVVLGPVNRHSGEMACGAYSLKSIGGRRPRISLRNCRRSALASAE